MADENPVNQQYSLVHTLGVKPGIKRDGTTFESQEFSDGVWCRFQRGVPKKMGGYREIFTTFNGIPRGMITNSYNGVNYVFVGNENGLDVFTTGTTFGVGSGPFPAIIYPGYGGTALVSNTGTSFTVAGDLTGVYVPTTQVIFNQTNPTVYTVTTATYSAPNTTVNFTGGTLTGSPTTVWIDGTGFQADPRLLWQFDLQYSPFGGDLQLIAHGGLNLDNIDNGVETQVLVGNITPNSNQDWTFEGLADTGGQNPTYRPITADGGVCVLYPYIFVYGSNGFIANNHADINADLATYNAQSLTDWNGPTANQVNMSSAKIVKGMPVRGGTNSPSGLFWATDSLIRATFTGTTNFYWRYDIISSQISIMSSSSVVEMDGIFYWMGVDRFYLYNGSVSVLPNDKNVNWLFNNLNYVQRQKVWATKVPRYNEIWFFYPRGEATECTDAIIYNVKDKIWYDAGQAVGARRSCGYTTEIFPTPIWASWEPDAIYSPPFTTVVRPPSESLPALDQFYLEGDQTITFTPGSYFTFTNTSVTNRYQVDTSEFLFNATIALTYPNGATRVTATANFQPYPPLGEQVYEIEGGYGLWQHEFGLNKISFNQETSILSSVTTCDISWVGGSPSGDTATGVNRRMHLRRIEPDFVQAGDMNLTILGRKFARGDEETSGPFVFGPNDGKIDMRVEHREMRLKFESNTLNGNYEMGRLLITTEYGDERP